MFQPRRTPILPLQTPQTTQKDPPRPLFYPLRPPGTPFLDPQTPILRPSQTRPTPKLQKVQKDPHFPSWSFYSTSVTTQSTYTIVAIELFEGRSKIWG